MTNHPMAIAAHTTPVGRETHGGAIQTVATKPGAVRHPRIASGEGLYLWDTEGRRLIDASSGPIATNLGHSTHSIDLKIRSCRRPCA